MFPQVGRSFTPSWQMSQHLNVPTQRFQRQLSPSYFPMYRLQALRSSSYTTVRVSSLPVSVLKCRCVWFPVSPRIFCLLTATLSTRAASPPSTTKTCTSTRTSGTCKSLAAHILTCSPLHFVVPPCTVLFNVKLDRLPRGTLVAQNHCGEKPQADGAARISFIMQTTKPVARDH